MKITEDGLKMVKKDLYKKLGFKSTAILENPYGIKIYMGEEGQDDWGVEIPNNLCKQELNGFKYNKNFNFYLITEEEALEISRKYTEIAKRIYGEREV